MAVSKIHLKTDLDGLPLAFHLTGGEASDSRNFAILLDIGPDITPRAILGDKGYDAKANRGAPRRRGICPGIPYRDNAAAKPALFPKILYKGRARVEHGVGKIDVFVGSKAPWFEITDDLPQYAEYAPPG